MFFYEALAGLSDSYRMKIPGPSLNLDFSAIQVPSSSRGNRASSSRGNENDPVFIRDMFLANPDQLALLKQNNPRLADALLSRDLGMLFAKIDGITILILICFLLIKIIIIHQRIYLFCIGRFTAVLREQEAARAERERLRNLMSRADPFDAEAQRLIADEIRQKNIEANMEAAIEYHPESFGTVVMLYINCVVNGHPVKAFIDSGTSLISILCK